MNERLRLYNTKLQDRLAKTVEHKVQAEATLASVQIVQTEEKQTDEEEDSNKASERPIEIATDVLISDLSAKDAKGKESLMNDSESRTIENSAVIEDKVHGVEKNSTVCDRSKEEGHDENKKQDAPKKDPNRPRYTLAEMQQVLQERNRFKERISILEEVLESYVPG